MRLCFGTFATVLVKCKKVKIPEKKIIGTIIGIIDKNSTHIEDSASISKLKHCKISFPGNIERSSICKNDLTSKISTKIIPLLNTDKANKAIPILLSIIRDDHEIDSHLSETFKECFGIDKTTLLGSQDISLTELLASILLFTVFEVSNSDGRRYIGQLSKDLDSAIFEKHTIAENAATGDDVLASENKSVVKPIAKQPDDIDDFSVDLADYNYHPTSYGAFDFYDKIYGIALEVSKFPFLVEKLLLLINSFRSYSLYLWFESEDSEGNAITEDERSVEKLVVNGNAFLEYMRTDILEPIESEHCKEIQLVTILSEYCEEMQRYLDMIVMPSFCFSYSRFADPIQSCYKNLRSTSIMIFEIAKLLRDMNEDRQILDA